MAGHPLRREGPAALSGFSGFIAPTDSASFLSLGRSLLAPKEPLALTNGQGGEAFTLLSRCRAPPP